MKVLLVNGSPHENGCTRAALDEVASVLHEEGIASELFNIGTDAVAGCAGCGACRALGKCATDDVVNRFLDLAGEADGFVFGSPVHFASACGAMTSFMDRAFYADMCSRGGRFYLKPAAAVCSARRAGTTATFDQLNKYFAISEMPIVTSRYWNMVHGNSAAEAAQDLEGMFVMRTLGRNMAWLLKSIEAGRAAGLPAPKREKKVSTNFIR